MAMPTEASIYCSKCDTYNISSDNCFCDGCLQELKEKCLVEFKEFLKEIDKEELEKHFKLIGAIGGEDMKVTFQTDYDSILKRYKTNKEVVKE